MKPTIFTVLSIILLLGAGFGLGWVSKGKALISSSSNMGSDSSDANKSRPAPNLNVTVSEVIPIEVVRAFRRSFLNINRGTENANTESVVHSFEKFKKYVDRMDSLFKKVKGEEFCHGCKPGVALYFGSSYKDNFAQIKDDDTSCLFRGENTLVMVPMFFSEANKTADFPYILDKGKWRTEGQDLTVKTLAGSWSPVTNNINDTSFAKKEAINKYLTFFDDPDDGFDLGHTQP